MKRKKEGKNKEGSSSEHWFEEVLLGSSCNKEELLELSGTLPRDRWIIKVRITPQSSPSYSTHAVETLNSTPPIQIIPTVKKMKLVYGSEQRHLSPPVHV
ncbi:hypothetical protein AAC387_Pa03g3271 [Persea americana]